jgi:hypothetical protein
MGYFTFPRHTIQRSCLWQRFTFQWRPRCTARTLISSFAVGLGTVYCCACTSGYYNWTFRFWTAEPIPQLHWKVYMYRSVSFPVVFYGFETWFLALREEQDLMLETRGRQGRYLGLRGRNRKSEKIGQWGTSSFVFLTGINSADQVELDG